MEQYDNNYALNVIIDPIEKGEIRTALMDYVRLASRFEKWNIDHFYEQMLNQLVDITDYIDRDDEPQAIGDIYNLCKKHGTQVLNAINRIRIQYDDPFSSLPPNCLLTMLAERKHLREPVIELVESICQRLRLAIPITFQTNPPENEKDFNDKVSALLASYKEDFSREYPSVKFAHATVKPDHATVSEDLFIESKFIRGGTTPSKATEGIAADMIKYPENCHKLFIVYDRNRAILDDEKFCKSFETKGGCTVCIIR